MLGRQSRRLRAGSLTDPEVALVKALLAEDKYENQEILGFVNAARNRNGGHDHVNGGRISEVRSYVEDKHEKLRKTLVERFRKIPRASQNKMDALFSLIQAPANGATIEAGPFCPRVLEQILKVKTSSPLSLAITETDSIECKKSFNTPIKTIAAFANNKGGYFIFGVENATWKVFGLQDDKFEQFDLRDLNRNIRSSLGIGLDLQKHIETVNGKKIGLLYIPPANIKPVILNKDCEGIACGQILYRYPGEDRLIAAQDLQKLIEDRIRQLSETVLRKHLNNILKAGIENAAVLNVKTGEVQGKSGNFLIDEKLLPKLSFIKEGEFVEKGGSPALKLIGDVQLAGTIVKQVQPVNISEQDIIETFLKQEPPVNPEMYIQRYKETNKEWMPIFFYAKHALFSKQQLLTLLKKKPAAKAKQIENLKDEKRPSSYYKVKSVQKELSDLKGHTDLLFPSFDGYKKYTQALLYWNFTSKDYDYVFAFLNKLYAFYGDATGNDKGLIRKAIAYVDHLMHGG